MQAQLIALDWGTTSLRAYRLGAEGRVLEGRSLSAGIMQLPTTGSSSVSGFDLALEQAIGDWLQADPQLPVIACGMVGSAQGWREAAYQSTPASLHALSAALTVVRSRRGHDVHIIPGVIQASVLPNVMRGEETQVLGVLEAWGQHAGPLLIGLPGSHSKWVRVEQGRIVHFDTFMTGEVYAALCAHTLLGRTMAPTTGFDEVAFDRGVAVARAAEGVAGPLATIFSTRTLGLTGQLSGSAQVDYLSGLLIGHELAGLCALLRAPDVPLPEVVLVGSDALCKRYQRALQVFQFPAVTLVEQATERGLWQVARQAGLLTMRPADLLKEL
ncbi:2-dehydro-3-deoxygalactonokinase [Pseudomonas sp. DTU_2021_1001937_2_SI_NGA_ILE_001]|uniref:2-dehydro-3-deoxygalactonokinase n=1 Tax=Pseudomonas sp. DTU_2021_1001937_2_SI_NGA_ILE_001 TaxID=3077589 RepID=UPI0028FC0BED|nr:2-dehydro-3-deoxygalactonokinase [Pseudomonas sp. DTU_2021_1001937_2_SI_NGA_ILE_001]WNW10819.1 2-dehydro-3-deoxygalactonokinase [Pseudomonas sp. DTU_2021_1001937_2_SI_NGA_ILE_001]